MDWLGTYLNFVIIGCLCFVLFCFFSYFLFFFVFFFTLFLFFFLFSVCLLFCCFFFVFFVVVVVVFCLFFGGLYPRTCVFPFTLIIKSKTYLTQIVLTTEIDL